MANNPLTQAELQAYAQTSIGGVVYLPSGYIFATPVSGSGPLAYRLFDAGYITSGIISPNRLGTGAVGSGNLYLADDGTWKSISIPATPTLAQVTTAGNTTANSIVIGSSSAITASPYTLQVVGGAGGSAIFSNSAKTQGLNINLTTAGETRIYGDYFGAGVDQKLILGTFANRATQLVLQTSGNISIGTTTDSGYKLDVNGTARTSQLHTFSQGTYLDALSSNYFYTADTGSGTYGGLSLKNSINNYNGLIYTGRSGANNAIVFQHTTYSGTPTSDGSQVFTQTYTTFGRFNNGVYGHTLYIHQRSGGVATYPLVISNGINTTNSGVGILMQTADSTASVSVNHASIVSWKQNLTSPNVTSDMRFSTISDAANTLSEKMRISSTGNLLVGTSTDSGAKVTVSGSITASSALAQGVYFNNTLVAAANNDVLVGLDINPTFTNGAFTGVTNWGLRSTGLAQFKNTSGQLVFEVNDFTRLQSGVSAIVYGNGTTGNLRIYPGQSTSGFAGLYLNATSGGNAIDSGSTTLSLQTNSTTRLHLFNTTGNIGIGTTTDSGYKLDVVGADSRFNGVRVGIGAGGVSSNTVVGTNALANNTTGLSNTAVGNGSLRYNIDGSYNTAYGVDSLNANTGGGSNVAVGWRALISSLTAYSNVAIGTQALFNNTASNNTAVGAQAGYSNTSGVNLTAIGYRALYSNVTGNYNTALGYNALYNSTASSNTAFGDNAGFSTTSGAQNNSFGRVSLYFNTTGQKNNAFGAFSLYNNITGFENVAIGDSALSTNTSGSSNSALGNAALNQTTGSNNTAIGFQAGVANTTGSNNIFIGYGTTGVSATESNRTWIGNSSTTSTWLAGNVLIGTTTDAGYKLDVNGTFRAIGPSTGVYLGNNVDIQNLLTANALYIRSGSNVSAGLYPYSVGTGGIQLQSEPSQPIIRGAFNEDTTIFPVRNDVNNLGDVVIQGGGSERVRFKAAGNVGIGTATPSYPFHIASSAAANVFGTVQSTNPNGTAAWVAFNDQSDNVVYRVFGSGASGTQLGVALSRSASLMANLGGSGKFLIGTYSSTDLVFGASDQERMRIVSSTGNVLIGTNTDNGNKLNVSGSTNISGNLNVSGTITTTATYTNCGLTGSVNVATNSTEIIGFTAKIDPNNWWTPATKKWSPTVAGFYFITLQVRWDVGTLGNQINIQILKNTNTVAIAQDLLPTSTGLTQTTTAIVQMNGSTDYLTFTGYTSSTTGEFIYGEPQGNWTFFNAFKLY